MSAVLEHKGYAPRVLGFATITVSDSRTVATDTSGDLLRRLIAEAGHRVVSSILVQDEIEAIRAATEDSLAMETVDVVVLTGGTGFSPRDVTLVALEPVFDAEVPGFGELFRMLSFEEVGAAAMLSRAAAGVAGGCAVFALPGSPKAVELAMRRLILSEAAHLVGQLRRT